MMDFKVAKSLICDGYAEYLEEAGLINSEHNPVSELRTAFVELDDMDDVYSFMRNETGMEGQDLYESVLGYLVEYR